MPKPDESPSGSPPHLPTDIHLESTVLAVADLQRSVEWYRSVVGLTEIRGARPTRRPPFDGAGLGDAAPGRHVSLGAHGHALVHLAETPAAERAPRGATGLYHHAILLPTRAALANFVRRLVDRRTPVAGASDHHVSEAIYLTDPDGHGVEVYADRPRGSWTWRGGRVSMTTDPLDVDDLLLAADATVADGGTAPAGTTLGHVHLKVRDADEAQRFYAGKVGFDVVATFPGATFLSTGGYHHRVGANAWESRGGAAAPDGSARLLRVLASVNGREAVAALRSRLTRDDGLDGDRDDAAPDSVEFHDPSGNRWRVDARRGA